MSIEGKVFDSPVFQAGSRTLCSNESLIIIRNQGGTAENIRPLHRNMQGTFLFSRKVLVSRENRRKGKEEQNERKFGAN